MQKLCQTYLFLRTCPWPLFCNRDFRLLTRILSRFRRPGHQALRVLENGSPGRRKASRGAHAVIHVLAQVLVVLVCLGWWMVDYRSFVCPYCHEIVWSGPQKLPGITFLLFYDDIVLEKILPAVNFVEVEEKFSLVLFPGIYLCVTEDFHLFLDWHRLENQRSISHLVEIDELGAGVAGSCFAQFEGFGLFVEKFHPF